MKHAMKSGLLIGLVWCGCLAKSPRLPERPIDLNTATATELTQLPRVGARTASRILAFRQTHGPFQRPEELMNVKGIGEKAFKRLAPYLATPAAAKAGEP